MTIKNQTASSPEQATLINWNKEITMAVRNALGAELDGDFETVKYPQGFNYVVKPDYYNKYLLETFDKNLSLDDGQVNLTGSFAQEYSKIVDNTEYMISSADYDKMHEEEGNQRALVDNIQRLYVRSGITPEATEFAEIGEIIEAVLKYVNSKDSDKPLDIPSINPRNYPKISNLVTNLQIYYAKAPVTNTILSRKNKVDQMIKAIKDILADPNGKNGSIQTGSTEYDLGWKLPDPVGLLGSLKNEKREITTKLSASNFNNERTNLSIENATSINVPLNWYFRASNKHTSEYNLQRAATTASELTIELSYTGITVCSSAPISLSNNLKTGWFNDSLITSVIENFKKDTSGPNIPGDEIDFDKTFGRGGRLSRLQTFVISQRPTVNLHFKNFNSASLKKVFEQETDTNVSILGGLINFSNKTGYKNMQVKESSDGRTLDVTLKPQPLKEQGMDPAKETAFILGGVPKWYGKK